MIDRGRALPAANQLIESLRAPPIGWLGFAWPALNPLIGFLRALAS